MAKYFIYNNGDAQNHGCEAIIRSTLKILDASKQDVDYISFNASGDLSYGIQKICNIIECRPKIISNRSFLYYLFRILSRLKFNSYQKYIFKELIHQAKGYEIALSVGGDNYCYKGAVENMAFINQQISKQIKCSILWGASIEPSLLDNKNVVKDLLVYNAIFCRESLTFDALLNAGIRHNVFLYPDPAFTLDIDAVELPKGFIPDNTIGINVSPLVIDMVGGSIVLDSYIDLINNLLKRTDCAVALIPHVVWEHNDDRKVLKFLYDRYAETNRVVLIPDYNCMQLKGIISKCRFFVGARTHATIAAYSSCVPTLVVGYSVKAKGIAKDLFGSHEDYVVSIQELDRKDALSQAFFKLYGMASEIKSRLNKIIPGYIKRSYEAGQKLYELINN